LCSVFGFVTVGLQFQKMSVKINIVKKIAKNAPLKYFYSVWLCWFWVARVAFTTLLQFEPKSRPSFSEIVTCLEKIISDCQKSKQQDTSGSDKRLLPCISSGSDEKTGKVASCLGARSEEVIPTSAAEAEALLETSDKLELKKCEWFYFIHLIHRIYLFLCIQCEVCKIKSAVCGYYVLISDHLFHL